MARSTHRAQLGLGALAAAVAVGLWLVAAGGATRSTTPGFPAPDCPATIHGGAGVMTTSLLSDATHTMKRYEAGGDTNGAEVGCNYYDASKNYNYGWTVYYLFKTDTAAQVKQEVDGSYAPLGGWAHPSSSYCAVSKTKYAYAECGDSTDAEILADAKAMLSEAESLAASQQSATTTTTTIAKAGFEAWPKAPDATVSLGSVSNGCGGGVASEEGRYGDESTFYETVSPTGPHWTVNFRLACNLHDAGYSGAKVADPINGGVIDYYGWTQARVDEKFLADMRKLCERVIPASAVVALSECKTHGGATSFGAETRYDFVHAEGHHFYNDRPTLTSTWGGHDLPQMKIQQRGRAVTVTWPDGEFRGTLVNHDQDSIVEGFAQSVASGHLVTSNMHFTLDPDQPNELKVSGAGFSGTLTR